MAQGAAAGGHTAPPGILRASCRQSDLPAPRDAVLEKYGLATGDRASGSIHAARSAMGNRHGKPCRYMGGISRDPSEISARLGIYVL